MVRDLGWRGNSVLASSGFGSGFLRFRKVIDLVGGKMFAHANVLFRTVGGNEAIGPLGKSVSMERHFPARIISVSVSSCLGRYFRIW